MPIELVTSDDETAQSVDPVTENIAALKELFPQAFGEGTIDFDTLRQLLGDAVDDGDERYGLNWSGKRAARRLALTPSTGTLRPAKEESVDWDTTQHLMIEGDNLEVLKLLQKSYAGKVKLIYIDPPYNTGSDFVYPDDYKDSIGNYLRRTGQVGEDAVKNSSNTESSGRFHTDWLNMIYPRLQTAKPMLSPDGFIFVSIDKYEVSNLIPVMNSVFGEENYRNIIVVRRGSKNVQAQFEDIDSLSAGHEYILCYSNKSDSRLPKLTTALADYQAGKWDTFWRGTDRPTMRFELFGIEPKSGQWRWSKDRSSRASENYRSFLSNGGKDENIDEFFLDHLQSTNQELDFVRLNEDSVVQYYVPPTGTKLLSSNWMDISLKGSETKTFDTEKHIQLLNRIVEWISEPNSLILDFFAGSGTTGHAVMAQNAADGGNRRYLLVQLPEPLSPDNKDQKAAADYCDQLGRPRTIAELTKERLRLAGTKIRGEHPLFTGDIGFRSYKLSTSNIRAWNPGDDLAGDIEAHISNLLPDRSEDDLLAELLLKTGLDLTTPMQTRVLGNKNAQCFGGGALITCFADISEAEGESLADGLANWHAELAPETMTTMFFRDTGFASNQAKLNLSAILEQRIGDKRLRLRSL